MKIFKTKIYQVRYAKTGGVDRFSGRYISDNEWLLKMIKSGEAKIKLN